MTTIMRFCPFGGKISYDSEQAAKRHRRGKGHHKRLKAYRCPNCHSWHLTTRS